LTTTGVNTAGGTGSGASRLILVFFFLTGITGLAYELVWIRLLILAFGSTQFAITTVLVTFMAGLAFGSLVFGRLVDRYHAPLKIYAGIEILLGIYCILSPLVFTLVRNLYAPVSAAVIEAGGVGGAAVGVEEVSAGFELAQFALAFSALIIPTTLMGGTLPILVKFLVAVSGRVGFHTAVPYAVNTLGAVTGCLATGFFALYFLGVKATVYAAGVADIIIGILVFVIFGRVIITHVFEPEELVYGSDIEKAGASVSSALDTHISRSTLNNIVLATFAVSGFASLSYEVLWTRVFSLVVGSSVYAFTIMLATFLVGIGAGSIIFAPFVDRLKRPIAWFAGLEIVIAAAALLSIFLYRELPLLFFGLKESFAGRFWLFSLVQFMFCAAIMIIPTLCMGAIFPLVGRIYTRGVGTVGRHIGDIYFFNTAGSIAGSFVAGFMLIPVIGVQNGVILIVALNLVIAAVLVWSTSARASTRGVVIAALAIFFVGTTALIPSWERMVMTTGLYVNPVKEGRLKEIRTGGFTEDLAYYKEGINAVITVRTEGNAVSYQANGKMEARAEGPRPAEAWSLLGHMPMLMHKGHAEDALVVGLGSGITLGAMEYYPLKDIDVIEIETAVVEASKYFSESNNNAIEDERVRLYITDGRSFLFNTPRTYDVIVSAVSDPWITGVSNLFTYEYFKELNAKLKDDDGIVSLWFQNYRITPAELKLGLNTFTSVFPYVSVWFHYTDALDFIVIGSRKPHSLDLPILAERFGDERIAAGLKVIGINNPFDLMELFLIGNTDLRRYIGTTGLNTDERPVLEFTLPKNMYLDPALGIKTVTEIVTSVENIVPPVTGVPEPRLSEFYTALGHTYNRSNFRLYQAYKAFQLALGVDPSNIEARKYADALAAELGIRQR